MNKNLLIALALIALVCAGVIMSRSARHKEMSTDFPEGMHWLCSECQHGFSTSREEFASWAAKHDEKLPCPECGKNTAEVAQKCPLAECGMYHVEPNVVIDRKVCCPVCRNPLP